MRDLRDRGRAIIERVVMGSDMNRVLELSRDGCFGQPEQTTVCRWRLPFHSIFIAVLNFLIIGRGTYLSLVADRTVKDPCS